MLGPWAKVIVQQRFTASFITCEKCERGQGKSRRADPATISPASSSWGRTRAQMAHKLCPNAISRGMLAISIFCRLPHEWKAREGEENSLN